MHKPTHYQRGDLRDFVAKSQTVEKTGGSKESGLAFKAKAEKRTPHFRKVVGGDKSNDSVFGWY